MQIQKSFQDQDHHTYGKLYVVPTPIGNLDDITIRALHTLKAVDMIAAEDTRQTRKLLNHFEINTTLVSYHEHNKESKGNRLIEDLKEGKEIALVSDAGMPAISDPGYELVRDATNEGISVIVLPGANAALCALVGSGLSTQSFYFYGFLPRKKKEQKEELEQLKYKKTTIIFYESPHRLKETVNNLHEVFGNRKIVLARELTKRYEEYARGSLEEIINWLKESEVRGEFCLIVEGSQDEEEIVNELWWSSLTIEEHVNYYIEEKSFSNKDAIKKVAQDRKLPKREVYQAYHID